MGWTPPASDTKASAWTPPSGDRPVQPPQMGGHVDPMSGSPASEYGQPQPSPSTLGSVAQGVLDYLEPPPKPDDQPASFLGELKSIGDTAQSFIDGVSSGASFGYVGEGYANNADHPIANFLGQGVGMLATGKGAVKALEYGAKAGVPLAQGALNFMAPQAGSKIGNVVRAAIVGGGAGAGDQLLRGGGLNSNTAIAAGIGIVGGPIAGKVLPMIPAGAKAIYRALGGDAAGAVHDRAIKALAPIIANITDPTARGKLIDDLAAKIGIRPPIAAALDQTEGAAAVALAADNPILTTRMREGKKAFEAQQPGLMQSVVADSAGPKAVAGGPNLASVPGIDNPRVQDINALEKAQSATMTSTLDPVRGNQVIIDKAGMELLSDPDLRSALGRLSSYERGLTWETLDQQALTGAPVTLPLGVMEKLRYAVGKLARGEHGPLSKYRDLRDSIEELATDQIPEYGAALEQYRADSDYIRGFEHGRDGKTIGEARRDGGVSAALDTPDGAAGHSAGITAHLAGKSGASEAGAASTASALAENAAPRRLAEQALGPAATPITEASAALDAANLSFKGATPPSVRHIPEQNLVESAVTAAGAGLVGQTRTMGSRIFSGIHGLLGNTTLPPAVQNKVADMLLSNDPLVHKQVFAYMEKFGVDEQTRVALQAMVGGVASINAGRFLAPTSQQ